MRESSDEAPPPQRGETNFPNIPTRPHTATNFRRLTASLRQYCGGGCPMGIWEHDFIEKLSAGVIIEGKYQGWKYWNCADPEGLTFNWKVHGGEASVRPVLRPATSPSVSQPVQSTVNTEAAAMPDINTSNTSSTPTGLQFNRWLPEQWKRAEASKREALKRRKAGGTAEGRGKRGFRQSDQHNKGQTANSESIPANDRFSANHLLQAAGTNPASYGKLSELQLRPVEH